MNISDNMKLAIYARDGLQKGISISFKIVVFTIPFYILVDVLHQMGTIEKIGSIFTPVMKLVGLPGDAAIVLVTGFFINLYAAIAVMVPLGLSVKQITILGLMLGIAHNLVIETIILSKTGAKAYIIVVTRLFVSLFAGATINLLWQ